MCPILWLYIFRFPLYVIIFPTFHTTGFPSTPPGVDIITVISSNAKTLHTFPLQRRKWWRGRGRHGSYNAQWGVVPWPMFLLLFYSYFIYPHTRRVEWCDICTLWLMTGCGFLPPTSLGTCGQYSDYFCITIFERLQIQRTLICSYINLKHAHLPR